MSLMRVYSSSEPAPPTQKDYLSDILDVLRHMDEQLTALRAELEAKN